MYAYGYTQHFLIVIYWQLGWFIDWHEKELEGRMLFQLFSVQEGSRELRAGQENGLLPTLELSQLLSWLGDFPREQAAKQRSHPSNGRTGRGWAWQGMLSSSPGPVHLQGSFPPVLHRAGTTP